MGKSFGAAWIVTAVLAGSSLISCQGVETTGPVPTPNATQQARILTDTAESKYLTLMSVDLAALVREQPWYKQLTQAHVDLVAALMRTERAAKGKGEQVNVLDLLTYAAAQPWYADGLDDPEARGLRGVFAAYEESLTNRHAPAVYPLLSQALQHGAMRAVDLPRGGEMLLVVSAEKPEDAQAVLDMALEAVPQIEHLVGAYPYDFLHMMVTELGDFFAGLSYDQYIIVAPDYIDRETVIHEATHSTMYGTFPTWFEEGFAHFVEYYMTDTLDAGVKDHTDFLKRIGLDDTLWIGPHKDGSTLGYLAERSQGFLFMKAVYDLKGIEGLMPLLAKLRTQTMGDQELMREFAQFGSVEEQRAMQDHLCRKVLGTARDYCR